MNKKTYDNLESTLNEVLEEARSTKNAEEYEKLLNSANELAKTICEIDEAKESDNKEELKVNMAKIGADILIAVFGAISLRSYAKMILKFESTGILTTTPGKGLAGLFRFKPFI